jgi:hypothetical protein
LSPSKERNIQKVGGGIVKQTQSYHWIIEKFFMKTYKGEKREAVKNEMEERSWWLMSVILATQEAEIRRIMV